MTGTMPNRVELISAAVKIGQGEGVVLQLIVEMMLEKQLSPAAQTLVPDEVASMGSVFGSSVTPLVV